MSVSMLKMIFTCSFKITFEIYDVISFTCLPHLFVFYLCEHKVHKHHPCLYELHWYGFQYIRELFSSYFCLSTDQ